MVESIVLFRFKIKEDVMCLCGTNQHTVDYLIDECPVLEPARIVLINRVTKNGGTWPITKSDLVQKFTPHFIDFVKDIDFELLSSC